ncbi:hypothetical protein EVAR_12259_1 [Eumeta japonica]|uniref:Uncharacterized protein n=1 Tax=Eumeta variegata TaxID=151549 RepID=A0A4C1TUG0_EUMVA|nr:hypothetical protein EVAR_12259_1 [Eumeta japonica]
MYDIRPNRFLNGVFVYAVARSRTSLPPFFRPAEKFESTRRRRRIQDNLSLVKHRRKGGGPGIQMNALLAQIFNLLCVCLLAVPRLTSLPPTSPSVLYAMGSGRFLLLPWTLFVGWSPNQLIDVITSYESMNAGYTHG